MDLGDYWVPPGQKPAKFYTTEIRGVVYRFMHMDDPRWQEYRNWVDTQLFPLMRHMRGPDSTPYPIMVRLVGDPERALDELNRVTAMDSPERRALTDSIKGGLQVFGHGLEYANPHMTRSQIDDLLLSLTPAELVALKVEAWEVG